MEASPCHMGCAMIADGFTLAIGATSLVPVVSGCNLVRGDHLEQLAV